MTTGLESLNLENFDVVKSQKEAEKSVSGFTHEEWKWLRLRAKKDLFFLCYSILGYAKLSENLHGHLCLWLEQSDEEQFREILLPRSHYKSTVVTISDSIRIVLPDDSGEAPWPRNLGTDCRVLLAHEVHDMAARFLQSVAGHFLTNPLLMGLFPECVPNPKKHRINKYELELPRTQIWSEPTFDTIGVGARGQGRHYNYLKLDDLFGDKARDSATERQTTYDWFDNIQSFFSTFARDHFDLIGTRWAYDDLYSHAHGQYGKFLKKYIRGVEEKDKAGVKHPIFPEEFPQEQLQILKKNRKVFSAQYANDPSAGIGEFEEQWKRFYEWEGISRVVIPGGGSIDITRETDNVIFIDPANDGTAGYAVTGMDERERVYILKAKKGSWKPPELVNEIFLDVIRFQPRVVVIESVNFSEIYQYWITAEMAKRGIRFRVAPAKTRNRSKHERVRGLSNYFSAGQIYFHVSQEDLLEEYDSFGASKHIHILDALAYGPEFWKRGGYRDRISSIGVDSSSKRDMVTGYSSTYGD